MKKLFTLLSLSLAITTSAQTTIANAGFELWGNPSPGVAAEPTGWYSNKSGSSIAQLGPQICFQDNAIKHSGNSSVRCVTSNYLGTAVNGAVTTGVINAPTLTKADGYIGTINYTTASDIRRMNFTGRPDSLVGWYQYFSGGAGEQGKVRAILHSGSYFDPETPLTYHAACTANKIGDALFLGSTSTFATWKRFSVPFNYVNGTTPSYIMINITSSANQATTITGSKIWIDDLDVIYNTTKVHENSNAQNVKVYSYDKTVYVDFSNRSDEQSTINIFDLTGKMISTQKLEGNKINTLNLSSLNSGLYLYQVNGTDYTKSGKLILE